MAIEGFEFNVGDELFYTGFAGTLQSSLVDAPEASTIYTLQRIHGIAGRLSEPHSRYVSRPFTWG